MITLWDSPLAKGQLYDAHFCYIVSAAVWSTCSNECAKVRRLAFIFCFSYLYFFKACVVSLIRG
jgi:hypothetical protein